MCLQPESHVQFWSTNLKNHRATRTYIGKGKKGQSKLRMFLYKERLNKLKVFGLEKDMTTGGT